MTADNAATDSRAEGSVSPPVYWEVRGSAPSHAHSAETTTHRVCPAVASFRKMHRVWVQIRGQHRASSRVTCPQVRSALSRARKEETVEKLVAGLESSACVFGVRYKNISVSSKTFHLHTAARGGCADS